MRVITKLVIWTLLISASSIAAADGNDLLRKCSPVLKDSSDVKDTEWLGVGYCMGMVQGVTNLSQLFEIKYKNDKLFCLPEGGIENGQAARIVVKYLQDNPQNLHIADVGLVAMAFISAYPCK